MIQLCKFDFSENSLDQINAIGFPFDEDANVMFMNLIGVTEAIILLKNFDKYNEKDKYQKALRDAIGKNPDLRISLNNNKTKLFRRYNKQS